MIEEGFELYIKGKTPRTPWPRVSILKRGAISFNEAAFGALGSPKAVQLLFNRTEQLVGIRPCDPSHPSAHSVRSQAGARSYVVGCQGFLQFCGIKTDVSRRYRGRLQGSMLEVDLKQAEDDGE